MTDQEKIKIKELHNSGAGYKSIATETGISEQTIKSFLKREEGTTVGHCLTCGTPIKSLPHRKKKVFCSDHCRMVWWKNHSTEINRQAYYSAVCRYCGKNFEAYGNSHRMFCSKECFTNSRRKDGQ